MMTKEERCRLALGYHRQHYNCGQSVLGAFRNLTGLTEEQCWGLGSGLGSGMRCGGICGAVSGGVLVLGLLHPYTAQEGPEGRRRSVEQVKEFQRPLHPAVSPAELPGTAGGAWPASYAYGAGGRGRRPLRNTHRLGGGAAV